MRSANSLQEYENDMKQDSPQRVRADPVSIPPYNRLGKPTQISDALGSWRTIEYTDEGLIAFESSGIGSVVEHRYDALLRPSGARIRQSSSSGSILTEFGIAYETGGSRVEEIVMGDHAATYSYYPNSSLVRTLAYEKSASPVLTISRGYDSLNRLTSIGSSAMEQYAYQYNDADQRTRVDREDGSHWEIGYDNLGQVISGKRYWSSKIPVEGQQFDYTFDDIGNRTETTRNGRTAQYEPNLLNQIESRGIPGVVDLLGHAQPEATVTVNQENVTRQKEGYFHKELVVANDVQDVYEEVTTIGVRNGEGPNGEDVVSEISGHVFMPADPEVFDYEDGNLVQSGQWDYTWDAENRLIAMETRSDLSSALPRQRLEFTYDYQGRRTIKRVFELNESTSSFDIESETRFVYQGWNLIAEIDGDWPNDLIRSYAWGIDLSDTLEGAGGVGGLLAIKDHDQNTVYYPAYDGNGNVISLIDSADASIAAIYEYGPFGEAIRASGPAAEMNPFRFSTKYQDEETELYYYGYRFYDSDMGRFLNRDPINEMGSMLIRDVKQKNDIDEERNVYAFSENDLVNSGDYLGLSMWCWLPWVDCDDDPPGKEVKDLYDDLNDAYGRWKNQAKKCPRGCGSVLSLVAYYCACFRHFEADDIEAFIVCICTAGDLDCERKVRNWIDGGR